MGVKNLWKILEPAGRPIAMESLRGEVLAVGEEHLVVQCYFVADPFSKNVLVVSIDDARKLWNLKYHYSDCSARLIHVQ